MPPLYWQHVVNRDILHLLIDICIFWDCICVFNCCYYRCLFHLVFHRHCMCLYGSCEELLQPLLVHSLMTLSTVQHTELSMSLCWLVWSLSSCTYPLYLSTYFLPPIPTIFGSSLPTEFPISVGGLGWSPSGVPSTLPPFPMFWSLVEVFWIPGSSYRLIVCTGLGL